MICSAGKPAAVVRPRPGKLRFPENTEVDGDSFNGVFIKEMGAVEQYYNMHPRETMFSEDEPGISDGVSIIDQAETDTQAWLDDDRNLKKKEK